jgi:hypothetical protein
MNKIRHIIKNKWRPLLIWVILITCLTGSPAMGAEGLDADADKILKSMSSYLGGLKSFSMKADIDFEVVVRNGQKIQLSSYGTFIIQRPSKFFVTRKGAIADAMFIFDGETLTIYGKNLNKYSRTSVVSAKAKDATNGDANNATIDDAIIAYESDTGIPAPGADLLFADSYTILSSGVESSLHVGTAWVNGVECHHLAFREANTDWQLWVTTGDKPLPVKYVITSKWHTGAPQYEIRLSDWNTAPSIKKDQFSFTAPAGAEELEAIPGNAIENFKAIKEEM